MKAQKHPVFEKDARRKHHHFMVTLYYGDGKTFARIYTDHEKAKKFAARQAKSPVVERTRVSQVS